MMEEEEEAVRSQTVEESESVAHCWLACECEVSVERQDQNMKRMGTQ